MLGKTEGEIRRLPSREFTGWIAYFQVKDWIHKAEADTPEQALAFARAVHEIFVEREGRKDRADE